MRFVFLLAFLLAVIIAPALATVPDSEGIGWIPTWKQAQAEATAAHKPILLVAAAPQCAGVPGIW